MPRPSANGSNRMGDIDSFFERASKRWDEGELKSAFHLFLAGAKSGDSGSQLNLGTFYCDGIGVKPNRDRALYWYRRAYKLGQRCAANNIAVLFSTEGKSSLALSWFGRAAELGDGDANVEMAKLYLLRKDRAKAIQCLRRAVRGIAGDDISGAGREEAVELLKKVGK